MRYNPDVHHRQSIRLKGYDYAKAGAYFVTICAWGKECVFGEVRDGAMHPGEAGQVTERFWQNLTERFPTLALDALVIMPNHLHGIIVLNASEKPVEHEPLSPPTLGAVIRAFKSLSAISVNRLLGRAQRPVWQRNYYEHIIRDDEALDRIRAYVAANPRNWINDQENPANAVPPPLP